MKTSNVSVTFTQTIRRWVALPTCVAFLLTTLLPAAQAGTSNPIADVNVTLPADFSAIQLPSEIGKIDDIFNGKTGAQVIVVQDAHAIPDAQRSIRKAILYFYQRYGVNLVALEGASAKLDARMLKSFPDKERLNKVLGEYFDQGELAGGTAAAISGIKAEDNSTAGSLMIFQGVEDWPVYEQALMLYLAAMQKETEVSGALNPLKTQLQEEKNIHYSEALQKVDQALLDFRENQNDFLKTLEALAAVKAPEAGSELALLLEQGKKEKQGGGGKDFTAEVRALSLKVESYFKTAVTSEATKALQSELQGKKQQFQTSQITPEAFALALKNIAAKAGIQIQVSDQLLGLVQKEKRMTDIEGTKLFADFEIYAQSVKETLFKNDEDREIDRRDRRLWLATKMAKLEVSYEDWVELEQMRRDGTWSVDGKKMTSMDTLFEPHFEFYKNAQKRDEIFFKNLSTQLKDVKATGRSAVMVAGGFHAHGLCSLLKENGISYALVMPEIKNLPAESHYRDQMRGKFSWSSYFEVENGKVNVYNAFIRSTRDRLLNSHKTQDTSHKSEASDPRLLKNWRDQIIRDLADEGRITKAGEYTRFIDELTGAQRDKVIQKRLAQVDKFIEDLKVLDAQGQFTAPNIAKLFQPATAISFVGITQVDKLASASLVGAQSEVRAVLELDPESAYLEDESEQATGVEPPELTGKALLESRLSNRIQKLDEMFKKRYEEKRADSSFLAIQAGMFTSELNKVRDEIKQKQNVLGDTVANDLISQIDSMQTRIVNLLAVVEANKLAASALPVTAKSEVRSLEDMVTALGDEGKRSDAEAGIIASWFELPSIHTDADALEYEQDEFLYNFFTQAGAPYSNGQKNEAVRVSYFRVLEEIYKKEGKKFPFLENVMDALTSDSSAYDSSPFVRLSVLNSVNDLIPTNYINDRQRELLGDVFEKVRTLDADRVVRTRAGEIVKELQVNYTQDEILENAIGVVRKELKQSLKATGQGSIQYRRLTESETSFFSGVGYSAEGVGLTITEQPDVGVEISWSTPDQINGVLSMLNDQEYRRSSRRQEIAAEEAGLMEFALGPLGYLANYAGAVGSEQIKRTTVTKYTFGDPDKEDGAVSVADYGDRFLLKIRNERGFRMTAVIENTDAEYADIKAKLAGVAGTAGATAKSEMRKTEAASFDPAQVRSVVQILSKSEQFKPGDIADALDMLSTEVGDGPMNFNTKALDFVTKGLRTAVSVTDSGTVDQQFLTAVRDMFQPIADEAQAVAWRDYGVAQADDRASNNAAAYTAFFEKRTDIDVVRGAAATEDLGKIDISVLLAARSAADSILNEVKEVNRKDSKWPQFVTDDILPLIEQIDEELGYRNQAIRRSENDSVRSTVNLLRKTFPRIDRRFVAENMLKALASLYLQRTSSDGTQIERMSYGPAAMELEDALKVWLTSQDTSTDDLRKLKNFFEDVAAVEQRKRSEMRAPATVTAPTTEVQDHLNAKEFGELGQMEGATAVSAIPALLEFIYNNDNKGENGEKINAKVALNKILKAVGDEALPYLIQTILQALVDDNLAAAEAATIALGNIEFTPELDTVKDVDEVLKQSLAAKSSQSAAVARALVLILQRAVKNLSPKDWELPPVSPPVLSDQEKAEKDMEEAVNNALFSLTLALNNTTNIEIALAVIPELSALGFYGRGALPALFALAYKQNRSDANKAVNDLLIALSPFPEATAHVLIPLLESQDPAVARQVSPFLADIGGAEGVIEALKNSLKMNKDSTVQSAAAEALGPALRGISDQKQIEEVIAILIDVLNNPNSDTAVVSAAAKTVAGLGAVAASALPALFDAAYGRGEKNNGVARAAIKILLDRSNLKRVKPANQEKPLLEAFRNSKPEVAAQVVVHLGRINQVEVLANALNPSADLSVQRAVAKTLGIVLPAILRRLKKNSISKDVDRINAVVTSLVKMILASSADKEAVTAAVKILAMLGDYAAPALPALFDAAYGRGKKNNVAAKKAIRNLLARRGSNRINPTNQKKPLLEAFGNAKPEVASQVADHLGRIGVVHVLVEALKSSNENVQAAAASALGTSLPFVLGRIADHLDPSSTPAQQAKAVRAQKQMAAAVEGLRDALQSSLNAEVVTSISKTLAKLGDYAAPAIPALFEAAFGRGQKNNVAAVETLGVLLGTQEDAAKGLHGTVSVSAQVPFLIMALKSPTTAASKVPAYLARPAIRGEPGVLLALQESLKTMGTRRLAAEALAPVLAEAIRINSTDPNVVSVVADLAAMVSDVSVPPEITKQVMKTLAGLGDYATPALPALLEAAYDRHNGDALSALTVLLGTQDVAKTDKTPFVPGVLGTITPPIQVAFLATALKGQSQAVVVPTLDYLSRFQLRQWPGAGINEAVINALKGALESGSTDAVRAHAARVLGPVLRQTIAENKEKEVFQNRADPKIAGAVTSLIEAANKHGYSEIVWALQGLGEYAAPAIPALFNLGYGRQGNTQGGWIDGARNRAQKALVYLLGANDGTGTIKHRRTIALLNTFRAPNSKAPNAVATEAQVAAAGYLGRIPTKPKVINDLAYKLNTIAASTDITEVEKDSLQRATAKALGIALSLLSEEIQTHQPNMDFKGASQGLVEDYRIKAGTAAGALALAINEGRVVDSIVPALADAGMAAAPAIPSLMRLANGSGRNVSVTLMTDASKILGKLLGADLNAWTRDKALVESITKELDGIVRTPLLPKSLQAAAQEAKGKIETAARSEMRNTGVVEILSESETFVTPKGMSEDMFKAIVKGLKGAEIYKGKRADEEKKDFTEGEITQAQVEYVNAALDRFWNVFEHLQKEKPGQYEFQRFVDGGSEGDVYKLYDAVEDKSVALKVAGGEFFGLSVPSEDDPEINVDVGKSTLHANFTRTEVFIKHLEDNDLWGKTSYEIPKLYGEVRLEGTATNEADAILSDFMPGKSLESTIKEKVNGGSVKEFDKFKRAWMSAAKSFLNDLADANLTFIDRKYGVLVSEKIKKNGQTVYSFSFVDLGMLGDITVIPDGKNSEADLMKAARKIAVDNKLVIARMAFEMVVEKVERESSIFYEDGIPEVAQGDTKIGDDSEIVGTPAMEETARSEMRSASARLVLERALTEGLDLYAALGFTAGEKAETLSRDDLQTRYRQTARENHPDRNPGDRAADDKLKAVDKKFKDASEAWEVLEDASLRARYDKNRIKNKFLAAALAAAFVLLKRAAQGQFSSGQQDDVAVREAVQKGNEQENGRETTRGKLALAILEFISAVSNPILDEKAIEVAATKVNKLARFFEINTLDPLMNQAYVQAQSQQRGLGRDSNPRLADAFAPFIAILDDLAKNPLTPLTTSKLLDAAGNIGSADSLRDLIDKAAWKDLTSKVFQFLNALSLADAGEAEEILGDLDQSKNEFEKTIGLKMRSAIDAWKNAPLNLTEGGQPIMIMDTDRAGRLFALPKGAVISIAVGDSSVNVQRIGDNIVLNDSQRTDQNLKEGVEVITTMKYEILWTKQGDADVIRVRPVQGADQLALISLKAGALSETSMTETDKRQYLNVASFALMYPYFETSEHRNNIFVFGEPDTNRQPKDILTNLSQETPMPFLRQEWEDGIKAGRIGAKKIDSAPYGYPVVFFFLPNAARSEVRLALSDPALVSQVNDAVDPLKRFTLEGARVDSTKVGNSFEALGDAAKRAKVPVRQVLGEVGLLVHGAVEEAQKETAEQRAAAAQGSSISDVVEKIFLQSLEEAFSLSSELLVDELAMGVDLENAELDGGIAGIARLIADMVTKDNLKILPVQGSIRNFNQLRLELNKIDGTIVSKINMVYSERGVNPELKPFGQEKLLIIHRGEISLPSKDGLADIGTQPVNKETTLSDVDKIKLDDNALKFQGLVAKAMAALTPEQFKSGVQAFRAALLRNMRDELDKTVADEIGELGELSGILKPGKDAPGVLNVVKQKLFDLLNLMTKIKARQATATAA